MVQLVETANGQLAGQYQETILKPDGQLEVNSATLAGVASADKVTFSLKSGSVITVASMFGTLDGQQLTLNVAGQSIPENYSRSDPSEFQRYVAVLQTKSREILDVNAALHDVQHFIASDGKRQKQIADVERQYQEITTQMSEYLNYEKRYSDDPQAAAGRDRYSNAINQASIKADQLHSNSEIAASDLRNRMEAISGEVKRAFEGCQQTETPVPSNVSMVDRAIGNDPCQRLVSAGSAFQQSLTAADVYLRTLEDSYRREREKQNVIVTEGNRLK